MRKRKTFDLSSVKNQTLDVEIEFVIPTFMKCLDFLCDKYYLERREEEADIFSQV